MSFQCRCSHSNCLYLKAAHGSGAAADLLSHVFNKKKEPFKTYDTCEQKKNNYTEIPIFDPIEFRLVGFGIWRSLSAGLFSHGGVTSF